MLSITKKSLLIIFLILVLDQALKIWVKTSLTYGQSIPVLGNWFFIKFIENPGMAFGIDVPGKYGKPFLTVFRILAAIGIGWYLRSLIRSKAPAGLIYCLSVVMAGATGNIIDSVSYGLIFSESNYFAPAEFFPAGGGYAGLMYGKVVDMLYFHIIEGSYPRWLPILGGNEFVFFRPIFNIADSSISVGVIVILVFQNRFFGRKKKGPQPDESQDEHTEAENRHEEITTGSRTAP